MPIQIALSIESDTTVRESDCETPTDNIVKTLILDNSNCTINFYFN